MDKYVIIRQIGRGSFGKCNLVQRKLDKKPFVLKEVNVQEMSPNERKEAMNEVNVLSVLRHPNIIAYNESFVSEGVLNIVMEYAEGGDLHQAIQKRQSEKKSVSPSYFSEQEIMELFCQISLALQYTHQKNILHRDLKTQNIFLSGSKIVKLGDFGIAKVLNSDTEFAKTIIGTPYYLSPEMCEDQPYDSKSDIWALGCVLYELATLRHAFDAHNLPALVLKILKGDYPPIPQIYSKDLSNLVKSMLRTDPKDRPSVREILETTLVQKYLPGAQARNVSLPRRISSAGVRRPSGDSSAAKKPLSPEKLQFLKLRNEVKPAKSKDSLRKGSNSPIPSHRGKVPVVKSASSPLVSPRIDSSSSSSSKRIADSKIFVAATKSVDSPRSKTPPISNSDSTPPRTPRPFSSPAVSHRSSLGGVPTPRPPIQANMRTPEPSVAQRNQIIQQRSKSEPPKRTTASSVGVRKVSIPTLSSQQHAQPPKPTVFIAKKRAPQKLATELKEHEQKFKDHLKSVKPRITRDLKPFQNSPKQDEVLSPSSSPPRTTLDDTAIPTQKNADLFILIPPATPPQSKRSNNTGTVSAPVTPRRVAPPAPTHAFNASSKRTQGSSPALSTAQRTQTQKSPASKSTASTDAQRTQKSPASVAQDKRTASAQEAAALKAAASSQAILRKQKSFTAKTESLKEVIKKNRRMIRKEGGNDELNVQIVLPKHMEHLLKTTQIYPDLDQGDRDNLAGDDENEEHNGDISVESFETTSVGENNDNNLETSTCDESTHEEGNGGDESKVEESEIIEERLEDIEEDTESGNVNNNQESEGDNEDTTNEESPKNEQEMVRLSTDLSEKMDKLSIRIETLRQKCEQVFGEEVFFRVYKYLREMKRDTDDKEIQNTLTKLAGVGKLAYLRYVDQLIFCELQFYGS